jgi:hypothetical protein
MYSEQQPWIEQITPQDFPTDDLKLMAEIIGMTSTVKLLTEAPGCVFTMTTTWDREAMKRYIKRVYDGTKISRMNLCRQCKVNENYIHKICSNKKK